MEAATTALGDQPVRAVKVQPAKATQREHLNDAFLNIRHRSAQRLPGVQPERCEQYRSISQ
jgi:hypothetical protein